MLQAGGIFSGLDTQNLIEQLVQVEKSNQDPVRRAKAQANSQKSAILQLNTRLTSLVSSLGKLDGLNADGDEVSSSAEVLRSKATSADEDSVGVDVDDVVTPGVYTVQVTTLASAARRDHSGAADATASLSAGDAVFAFSYAGGEVQTVDITGGTTTLEDLADSINALESGVRATIIDTGVDGPSRHRLVLDGEEVGASNTVDIDASTTLAGFADTDFGSKLATNASLTVNGIAITSESNTAEPVEGLKLELKTEGGDPVDVAVDYDTDALKGQLEKLVTDTNGLLEYMHSQSRYNTETQSGGVLSGDSLVLGVSSKLREVFGYSNPEATGPFQSLADIGMSFNSEGRLEIDSEKMNDALKDNPLAVRDLLRSTTTEEPQGLMARMRATLEPYTDSDDGLLQGRIDTLDSTIERHDDRLEILDARAEKVRARLQRDFARLENSLAALSTTQQFFATNQIGIY